MRRVEVVTIEENQLIANNFVEDNLAALVLREGGQFCQVLPRSGADEQFW